MSEKIAAAAAVLSPQQAAELAAKWRSLGKVVVFTNGVFDLLHRGHVDYLRRARDLGDALVVGLNSDASVHRIKGPDRPLMHEEDRAAVLAELRPVDVVVIFDEPTAETLVAAIRPAIYVKGGDWGAGQRLPPEAAVVERYGGQVIYLPYLPGRSTTALLGLIRQGT